MADYVIATIKSWNIKSFEALKDAMPKDSFHLITDPKELTMDKLKAIAPRYVFFPHWSWIISKDIYDNFECVVFHATDLPFGRGGSPLQNLIVRGIYDTKISAIKVSAGLDTGDVYLKHPINISEGNADQLLTKISNIIYQEMIPKIILENPKPIPQTGEPVVFQRRTESQSLIPRGLSGRRLYDYIRMLDGEGYPPAYMEEHGQRIYFRNANLMDDHVTAEAYFE